MIDFTKRLLLTVTILLGLDYPRIAAQSVDAATRIKRLEVGGYANVDLEELANQNALGAVPLMEREFEKQKDPLVKAKLAESLVRLHSVNDRYFRYLEISATHYLNDDVPSPIDLNAETSKIPPQAFTNYVRSSRVQESEAINEAINLAPATITLVAGTHDRRFLDILRRGLSSSNVLVVIAASKGLADLDDEQSVPAIISLCEKYPESARSMIAESLPFFSSPRAEAAAKKYLKSDVVSRLYAAKGRGASAVRN